MDVSGIAVMIGAVAALAGLGWFFFAPRRAGIAELAGAVQRIIVTVKAGTART
jgi:Cu+-exporting ATPase